MIPVDLGTMNAHIAIDTAGIDRGSRLAQQKMEQLGNRIGSIGRKLTLALTAPIAGAFTLGGRQFVRFQDAMTKSTAIMTDVTSDLRKEMERTALEIARNSSTSATELAQSYYFLASAGFTARQSVQALSAVQQFAVAGAFDMATATDLLTDAQTAMGMNAQDAAENMKQMVRVSDVLLKANVLANASTRQFSEALTNDAAVAARTFGAELETVVAVLASYANQGKKGAEAGSMIGRALRLLKKSAMDNAEAFRSMNIQVIGQNGEYRNFIDIIQDMETAFEGLTKPEIAHRLSQLGFEALAQKSITPLLGTSASMREYEKALRSAGGTTEEVFENQMKSPLERLKALGNRFSEISMNLTEALLPAIESVSKSLFDFTDWWAQLSESTKNVIGITLAVVAALGPLALALAGVIKVGSVLISVMKGIGVAMKFLYAHPLVALVAAVAAAIVVFWKFVLVGDTMKEKFIHLGKILTAVGVTVWESLKIAWHSMALAALWMTKQIVSGFLNLIHVFKKMPEIAKWMADNWWTILKDLAHNVVQIAKNIGKNLWRLGKSIKDFVTGKGWSFDPVWLNEGFENNISKFPDILDRSTSEMEKTLDKRMTSMKEKIGESGKKIGDAWGNAFEKKIEESTKEVEKKVEDSRKQIQAEMGAVDAAAEEAGSGPRMNRRFASAVEEGTIEAYNILAGRTNTAEKETAKNTKDMVNEQKRTTKAVASITTRDDPVIDMGLT